MLWQLKHGDKEKKIRDQLRMNKSDQLPDFMKDKPKLWLGLEFLWQAFWELTTCRPIGQGAEGPIPWDAVHWYALRHGVNGSEFDRFLFILRHMDVEYLGFRSQKSKKMNIGKNKGRGGGRKGTMKVKA